MKNNTKNEKYMFLWSVISLVYFTLLFLNSYIIKSDFVLIWVFQELLTLPFLGLVIFLYVISIKSNLKYKFSPKTYAFWSMIILNIILISMILSFYL